MRKSRLQWYLLSALLLLTIVLALCAGRYAVSVTTVLQILAGYPDRTQPVCRIQPHR